MTNFEKIQTAALARLDAGESLEHILQDYADYEEELRPILEEAAGVSLSSLMQKPSQKPKNKAKNNQATLPMPAMMIGLGVLLLAGLMIFLNMREAPISIPPSFPTTAIPQITIAEDDVCASLSQQQITSAYANERQNEPFNRGIAPESPPVDDDTGLEVETSVIDAVVMATPAPSGIIVAAPMEEPMSGSGGTGGGFGGDTSTTSSHEESPAIVGGLAPVVSTSVATYDERERDSDDYTMGESAASDVRSESSLTIAPVNQAMIMPLNAGEIDDNADWDTYQEYRRNFLAQYGTRDVRDVDTTDRQVIRVVDENGLPVLGACVQIYRGDSFVTASRTYATGLTLFFPNLTETTRYAETFRVLVSKNGNSAEASLDRNAIGGVTSVTLPISQANQTVQLDVLFLLDATGSMSDEIAQLQGNILAISAQLDAMPNDMDVRFGLVSYRDRGDEYVTRVYDFTDDIQVFQANLLNVVAGGGGDYPESLNEGFDMALNAVNWRSEDSLKLVFLVADAPPHVDYASDADYSLLMLDALARGIKVHPIASSGLQPEGEFVLRQIGQATMGHFLFLTYDEGVAGTTGEDRPDLEVGDAKDEQGIGDYSVSSLDELVLRLITDEIAALHGE